MSESAKDLILKLLVRKPAERIAITEVLEHPWIVGDDKKIMELRRKSNENHDDVLKFVAYSNTDTHAIQVHSPKQASKHQASLGAVTGAAAASEKFEEFRKNKAQTGKAFFGGGSSMT